MREWKMQEWKQQEQTAGVKNAGMEKAGVIYSRVGVPYGLLWLSTAAVYSGIFNFCIFHPCYFARRIFHSRILVAPSIVDISSALLVSSSYSNLGRRRNAITLCPCHLKSRYNGYVPPADFDQSICQSINQSISPFIRSKINKQAGHKS